MQEGSRTLIRGQEHTYKRARRTLKRRQEYTYERVGGHLREESDEELEGEP